MCFNSLKNIFCSLEQKYDVTKNCNHNTLKCFETFSFDVYTLQHFYNSMKWQNRFLFLFWKCSNFYSLEKKLKSNIRYTFHGELQFCHCLT